MKIIDWKPGKVDVSDPVLDKDGNPVLDSDGSPKIKITKKDSPFKGIVQLKMPKYLERMKLMKKCNFNTSNGKDEKTDGLDSMEKLIQISLDHIHSVKLIRIDDEREFNCIDDLEYDVEGSSLLNEIGQKIIGGARLGKN